MTKSDQIEYAIGQLLIGGFEGTTVNKEITGLAKRGVLGGVILFSRNFTSLEGARDLVATLHAIDAPSPLLFPLDQEGGRVQRLKQPFPELPPMRTFGEKARKGLVHRVAGMLARALRVLGFHQNYAPVLDVDSNPDNPIIGNRSFSRDPNVVARLGAAFIDGLQSNGVAACGKHFPGHGDTSVDSHLELPALPHDMQRLMELELVPFRAAARAQVASIMTAHVLFEALDADHPATLSEKVLIPVLRKALGFEGLIVSDDLEMKAIADHYGIEDAAVRAIRAGCDQLLICRTVDWIPRAHEAIAKAVEKGTLSRDRIFESAARVARFKERYVVGKPGPIAGDFVAHLPTSEHASLLAELEAGPKVTPADDGVVEYELEESDEKLELDV
jgi:beta-N-acetylhexosaminidase